MQSLLKCSHNTKVRQDLLSARMPPKWLRYHAEAGSQSNYQNRGVDAPMTIDELQVDIG